MCVTEDDIIQSETDDIHYDAFERQRQRQRQYVRMEKCCKLQCRQSQPFVPHEQSAIFKARTPPLVDGHALNTSAQVQLWDKSFVEPFLGVILQDMRTQPGQECQFFGLYLRKSRVKC